MTPPTTSEGWWLGILWVADADGVVSFIDVAPAGGPPPDPPLVRLGPSMAGRLSGLIREDDGRLAIRLTPVMPPEDPARPWRCPVAVRAAFGFEPARAAALRPNELADMVVGAFAGAVEGLSRP
jgi:hypothetical protein